MKAFIINTDKSSFEGHPHEVRRWVAQGLAFSSGRRKFGEAFRKIAKGDFCLMYENRIGVIAVGKCSAPWDEEDYAEAIYYTPLLYPPEYRLQVDWGQDLLPTPLPREELRKLCGFRPGWAPLTALWTLDNPPSELLKWMESQWHTRSCPFCSIAPNRVIAENSAAYAVRDAFPVSALHTLVIPKRHVADFFDLNQDELVDCNSLLRKLRASVLSQDETVEGFNIGINCGKVAGQTIFHCHFHLIPRRGGDVDNPRGGVRHVIPGKGAY